MEDGSRSRRCFRVSDRGCRDADPGCRGSSRLQIAGAASRRHRTRDWAMPEQDSVGDPIPPDCEVIEVHVAELKQLFNEIDPSPFRERDLDADAEEFIVGWAKDAPRK